MNISAPLEDNLFRAIHELVPPDDYIYGCPQKLTALPQKILAFSRTRAGQLGRTSSLHHRYVLICALEGAGNIIVNEHIFRLQPGESLLVFPLQNHYYAEISQEDPLWLFITFEYEKRSELQKLYYCPSALHEKDYSTLLQILTDFSAQDGDGCAAGTLQLLASVMNNCKLNTERAKVQISGNTSFKAIAYINANLDQELRIEEISRELMLSESRVRAIFKDETGISLGNYIRRAKIQYACSLLLSQECNVSQAASRCGFSSLYAFSRCFKQIIGLSPRKYTRQAANT